MPTAVDFDPFATSAPKPAPQPKSVDFDPFAAKSAAPSKSAVAAATPVDHDPFKATPVDHNPFLSKLKDTYIDEPVRDIKARNETANQELKKAFTTKPEMSVPGIAGRALDAASAVYDKATATPYGLSDASLGRGAEQVSGGKVKKEDVSNIAGVVVPFAGQVGAEMKAANAFKAAKTGPLGSMVKATKSILSPATVDDHAKAAATLHRSILGQRGIEADKAAYDLGKHQRVVGNASPGDQLSVIRYVENRSKGGTPIDPKLKPAADAIKKVADSYRKQIEYVMGEDGPSFVKDYYARMWTQKPEEVQRAVGGRQGSGSNLKGRRLPTYEDGLKAGLTPRYANPLDAMSAYADNMARFLGTHEILDGMKKSPEIGAKMFTPGQQPAGWVELKGMKTEDPARTVIKNGEAVGSSPKKTLYAPEGAARVYNNYLSKGLDQGDIGPIYRGARAAANGMVQLKLGLSAFHGAVMGQEGVVSEMARGIKQVSQGDVKGLGTIAASPAAPVKTALRGAKMNNQILEKGPGRYGVGPLKVGSKRLDQMTGRTAPSEFDAKLNKLYERTGMRLGMDKIYATRRGTSLLSSAIRGTLKRDLDDAVGRMTKGDMGDRAKGTVDLAGNIIQSTAAPLFEHYIPNMKRGAWSQQMSDYLKTNPNTTEAEQVKYGQRLADNIDNRFGELVVNNNFWNKTAYQIAQMLMLSPSWNIGTAREIGGGIVQIPESLKGLVKGKGITDKTAYVAALVGTTMAQNAVATYLHTGQMPEGEDFFAYRTGGTDAATGKPERAMMPGYMKDVLAFTMGDAQQEIGNKANPGLKTAMEVSSNKDFKGQPIWDPNAPLQDQVKQFGGYAADQLAPISMGQSSKPKKGSDLTTGERIAGVRPAPRYMTDPEGVKAAQEKRDRRAWTAKQKTDRKMQSRLEGQ